MKLSIIVPIFNVEDYIVRCAKSLIEQTASHDKFEIVFVNDGTKDNSVERLVEAFDLNSIPNCRIINKENGGLSSARNYGVGHSEGEYLWFVDSDDWIELNSVDIILSELDSSPDILFTSQMYKNVGNKQVLKYNSSYNTVAAGVDIVSKVPASCAVMYIVKRSFLNDNKFKFKEGIHFEDSELTPRMLYCAKKVRSIDTPLYHHFMRDESITHNLTEQSLRDLMTVLSTHIDFYQSFVKPEHKSAYASNISSKIIELLDFTRIVSGKTNKKVDDFFVSNPILYEMLRRCSHKGSSIYGNLLRIFPNNATMLFYIVSALKGRKIQKREV